MEERDREKLLAYAAGVGSSIIFGLSFLFTKEALEHTNPIYFLSYRFALAFVTINALRLLKVIRVRPYRLLFKDLFVLSLIQPVLYFLLENVGVSFSTSSEAGILISTIPIFVILLARIFLKERVTTPQLVSVALALAGILLITLGKGFVPGENPVGPVILLASTVTAALYNILSRRSSVRFRAWEITYHMMTMGFFAFATLALILSLLRGETAAYLRGIAAPGVTLAALYLGTLSSVLAFFLINFMLSKLEASRAAVFAYLSTVVSLSAGVIFRGESFSGPQLLGVALILVGVWGANALARRKKGEKKEVVR